MDNSVLSFVIFLFIIILAFLFLKRIKLKKQKNRLDFNKKYTNQFRALGRKANKSSKEFKQLYKKMHAEKRRKGFN